MFKFFFKKKVKKVKTNNDLKKILLNDFNLYKKGFRYNYYENLLENWKI